MPAPVDYDLSQISTHIIIYSDRVHKRGSYDPRVRRRAGRGGPGPSVDHDDSRE